MLTALSVAHECGMVAKLDRIVLVEAYLAPGDYPLPQVQFTYEDNVGKNKKQLELVILSFLEFEFQYGSPHGRLVESADFITRLYHLIISLLWVSSPTHGTCETYEALLLCVPDVVFF